MATPPSGNRRKPGASSVNQKPHPGIRRASAPRWALGAGVLLAVAAGALADELVLSNGDHIEARILQQSGDRVIIERHFRSGILYRQTLNTSDIVRIIDKPFDLPVPEAPEKSLENPIELGTPAPPPGQDDLLRSAIDKYREGGYATAATYLTRLINHANSDHLPDLSTKCMDQVGLPLDAFAAEVRLRVALDRGEGMARIMHVTRYERSALITLLDDAVERTLTAPIAKDVAALKHLVVEEVGDARGSATSRPSTPGGAAEAARTVKAPSGWTLEMLVANADAFDGDTRDAQAAERQLRLTLTMLSERMRLDLDLRRNRGLKDELVARRVALAELLEKVSKWAGGGLTPKEEATLAAEQRYLKLVNETRQQWAEQVRKESVRKARIAAGLPPEPEEKEPRPSRLSPLAPTTHPPVNARRYEGTLYFTGGAAPPTVGPVAGRGTNPTMPSNAYPGWPSTTADGHRASTQPSGNLSSEAYGGGELVPTTPYRTSLDGSPLPSFSTGGDRSFAPPPSLRPSMRGNRPPPLPDFTPVTDADQGNTGGISAEPAESASPSSDEGKNAPPLPDIAPLEEHATEG